MIRKTKYRHLKKRMVPFVSILIIVMIIMLPGNVVGKMYEDNNFPQPDEFAALPRWCQIRLIALWGKSVYAATVGEKISDSAMREDAKWEKIIGEDIYVYCHHYIFGLNWTIRHKNALMMTGKEADDYRKLALDRAIAEFNFMRGHKEEMKKHKLYDEMLKNEIYIYTQKKNSIKVKQLYIELKKRNP